MYRNKSAVTGEGTAPRLLRPNKYEKQRIISSVAIGWLKSSERIIAEGGRPAKLSDQAREHVISELSMFDTHPSSAEITKMANKAIAMAKEWLMVGRYKTVKDFFSQPIDKVEGSASESEYEQDRDDLIDDGRSDGYGESYAERNV